MSDLRIGFLRMDCIFVATKSVHKHVTRFNIDNVTLNVFEKKQARSKAYNYVM